MYRPDPHVSALSPLAAEGGQVETRPLIPARGPVSAFRVLPGPTPFPPNLNPPRQHLRRKRVGDHPKTGRNIVKVEKWGWGGELASPRHVGVAILQKLTPPARQPARTGSGAPASRSDRL
jgi:hypothetical protein